MSAPADPGAPPARAEDGPAAPADPGAPPARAEDGPAAAPAPPDAEAPASPRAARALRLAIPSGALLALCFFLPAIDSCGKPLRPFEVPTLAAPYLLGLVAALWAALRLSFAPRRLQAAAGWATWASATVAPLPPWAHLVTGVTGERVWLARAWLVALWLVPIAVLLRALRLRRRRPDVWMARCYLAGAAQSLGWFHYWVWATPLSQIHYGLWLSIAASLGLLLGGALLDRARA